MSAVSVSFFFINTTVTSCNNDKELQSMTQTNNGALSTSSTTSCVGLSSFGAKKKKHLQQTFVGQLKQ
jgi:hypothetical protein